MSFKTADGQKAFGSIFKQRKYDEAHAKSTNEKAQKSKSAVETPKAIVEAHGPAVAVKFRHSFDAGKHSVMSEHPDGFIHRSEHPSAEAAHAHGMKLGTTPVDENAQQSAPSEDDGLADLV